MKRTAPKHVAKYCIQDWTDKAYCRLVEEYEDDYHFVHKIKCTCGSSRYKVYVDEHPSVFLECRECQEKITVYDLKYYPAAIKLEEKLPIKLFSESDYMVYVMYEYSDESEMEEDVEDSSDDITWAMVFAGTEGKIELIIDDETA